MHLNLMQVQILENVSFSVQANEMIAVVRYSIFSAKCKFYK